MMIYPQCELPVGGKTRPQLRSELATFSMDCGEVPEPIGKYGIVGQDLIVYSMAHELSYLVARGLSIQISGSWFDGSRAELSCGS